MRNDKKKAQLLQRDRRDSKYRQSGQDQYSNKEPPTENSSELIKSIVLKKKSKLAGEIYDNERLIDFDYVSVLRRLAQIIPDLKVRGGSPAEVLNNALIDFHKMALKKWPYNKGLTLAIWERKAKPKLQIAFNVVYPGTDAMASFPLKDLVLIKKRYSWAMPYIYAVIDHLTTVNKVISPDWSGGDESTVIESLVYNDWEEEAAAELDEYICEQKKQSAEFEAELKKMRIPVRRYNSWKRNTRIPRKLKLLLEAGANLLKNKENIWDYVHYPNTEGNPVGPAQSYRFYWSMDQDDQIWQYLSEMIDSDFSEYGAVGFYKTIQFEYKGRLHLNKDFPLLFDKFLFHLWEMLKNDR